jgi:hypothetical protein
MSNNTETNAPLDHALQVIHDTADYYHSMNASAKPDYTYWATAYMTALDLIERIQDLPEGSMLTLHDITCDCEWRSK